MRVAIERAVRQRRADDRDLRRARRRSGVGALLPRARARLRLLLALPRSRRQAGGGAGGARRERRGRVRGTGGWRCWRARSRSCLPLRRRRRPTCRCVPVSCRAFPRSAARSSSPRTVTPDWGQIGLRVVVVPARRKPARPDAFAYLAGGLGGAASEQAAAVNSIWSGVHERHDILLVDQRGTGGSHPLAARPRRRTRTWIKACLASLNGDSTQYGTAAAADDLGAVRRALGYRSLDPMASPTARRWRRSTWPGTCARFGRRPWTGRRSLTSLFWDRFAVNGQRALDLTARRCAREPACASVPELAGTPPLADRGVERSRSGFEPG